MNETFDSAAEKFSPENHPGDRHQNEVASAVSTWNENLKDNLFIVLLIAVAISFPAGYFISQQQEARKRDQWAEILFRQAKHWFIDRCRKTADSVEQGLQYARSAAEEAVDKGAEYSRRLKSVSSGAAASIFRHFLTSRAIYGQNKQSRRRTQS